MQYTLSPSLISLFRNALQIDPRGIMDTRFRELYQVRAKCQTGEWRTFCKEFPERHRDIWGQLQRDPYTRHSAAQPRGYAGDAELILRSEAQLLHDCIIWLW